MLVDVGSVAACRSVADGGMAVALTRRLEVGDPVDGRAVDF